MTDLMIILGCPASGKTTLAHRLAAELTVPILSKDDIKEALFKNWRPEHAGDLRAVLARSGAPAAQIWCRASQAETLRRFTARVRQPGHLHPAAYCALLRDLKIWRM